MERPSDIDSEVIQCSCYKFTYEVGNQLDNSNLVKFNMK